MRSENIKPQKFENVTIYATGNVLYPCTVRIDVRRATLWVAPHAQYRRSVHMNYIGKRQRNARSLVVPDSYVAVVAATHAIDPADLFLPAVDGASSPRYDIASTTSLEAHKDSRHSAVEPQAQLGGRNLFL